MRDEEGTETENTYIRKETCRGGESVSPSSPFEKHDTTLEAAVLGPLAIYGNDSGKWGVEPKFLHDFRSAEKEREVEIFFFCSPQKNGGW